jgi:hypothetical protein
MREGDMTKLEGKWVALLTILVLGTLFVATIASFAVSDPK